MAAQLLFAPGPGCPPYAAYALDPHPPLSPGRFQLPYQRPVPACRTFVAPEVEDAIAEVRRIVADPDLFRLFENSFPNTLDTTIAWRGRSAQDPDEELTFITTGDIDAMWLRDSASQLLSYAPLLRHNASPASLASVFRGAINLQARNLAAAPHCNAFRAPVEATGAAGAPAGAAGEWTASDRVRPRPAADARVFECKFELDSLAAFLQLSHGYYGATGDAGFFLARPGWAAAVRALVRLVGQMRQPTYGVGGRPLPPPYTFERTAASASETQPNAGAGHPVRPGAGLVRSFFRPSDDACVFQLLIPANMQLARGLELCGPLVRPADPALAAEMAAVAAALRVAIETHGRVTHPVYGDVYAYEVDGYGSHYLMDDANVPSLLSAPLLGYLDRADPTYWRTRRLVLGPENPYFMAGPVLAAVGGAHVGPGMAWPLAAVVQALTADQDGEIVRLLRQLLASTDGLGLLHEAVSSHDAGWWTRAWFAWPNGLFGQLILDLRKRKPHLLRMSFQD